MNFGIGADAECEKWIQDRLREIDRIRSFYNKKFNDWMLDKNDHAKIMRSLDQLRNYALKGNNNPDHFDDLPVNQYGLTERKLVWGVVLPEYASAVNSILDARL